jgi:hypothetical protein
MTNKPDKQGPHKKGTEPPLRAERPVQPQPKPEPKPQPSPKTTPSKK